MRSASFLVDRRAGDADVDRSEVLDQVNDLPLIIDSCLDVGAKTTMPLTRWSARTWVSPSSEREKPADWPAIRVRLEVSSAIVPAVAAS